MKKNYYETIEAALEACENQTNMVYIDLLKDCTLESDVTISGNLTFRGCKLTNNATLTINDGIGITTLIEFVNNGTVYNYGGFTMLIGSVENNGTFVCNDILNLYGEYSGNKGIGHTYSGTLNEAGNEINATCELCGTVTGIRLTSRIADYTGKAQFVTTRQEKDLPEFEFITKQNGVVVNEAVKAGKYTQSVTIGGVTATAELEILHPAECIAEADDGDCTTPIKCAACDEVMTPGNEKHIGGTASCTTLANCDVCGTPYGSFDVNTHTGEKEVRDAVEATLESEGYTGDTYCLDCGEKIADGEIIPQLPCEFCSRAHKTTIDEFICILVRFFKLVTSLITFTR